MAAFLPITPAQGNPVTAPVVARLTQIVATTLSRMAERRCDVDAPDHPIPPH